MAFTEETKKKLREFFKKLESDDIKPNKKRSRNNSNKPQTDK